MTRPKYGNPKAVRLSRNAKIGDAAATYAPVGLTCPTACPLRGSGCYAEHGNVGMIQRRVNHGSRSPVDAADAARMEAAAVDAIQPIPGIPLRGHVSGDCTTAEDTEIVSASYERYTQRGGGKAWTYSHSWREVPRASWGAVSVMASCETTQDAIRARRRGYGAAIVVDAHPDDGKAWQDSTGLTIVPCPAQTRGVQCVTCGLCLDADSVRDRGQAVAFAVHGSARKRALSVIK